jgi:hypothetical protein
MGERALDPAAVRYGPDGLVAAVVQDAADGRVLMIGVSNIFRPSDIEGVYGAAGAGGTIIRGPQAIVLANQKGAVLELSGVQTGLMINLDLSGMGLSLAR